MPLNQIVRQGSKQYEASRFSPKLTNRIRRCGAVYPGRSNPRATSRSSSKVWSASDALKLRVEIWPGHPSESQPSPDSVQWRVSLNQPDRHPDIGMIAAQIFVYVGLGIVIAATVWNHSKSGHP
jgi:hypothetical protein